MLQPHATAWLLWLLWLLLGETVASSAVLRGPYLQSGTPHSVIVRWQTGVSTESVVHYGTQPNHFDDTAINAVQTSEHEVELTGLTPNTRYYYSVGNLNEVLASGPGYFFITAPLQARPTRIWVLGDSGTANLDAAAVRDAYQAFTDRHTDLWLMLGDNAYESGYDEEYQAAVFQMYPDMLRKSVLWPAIGNHDAPNPPYTHFPFLEIFTLPTQGEAGGVASGTERYYSFDYGNIHLVCLDSMTVSRASNGPMCNWLRADLEANDKDWLIAYWHHPPYSRGSHNSDYEYELVEMRENVVPILEQHGVDLVLCGHSHSYERSYLLDGHYGTSATLQPHMIKDSSGGRPCETGGYVKSPGESRAGAIYTVAGSSGQASGVARHPAMFMHLNALGSLVLDIDGDLLIARFLEATGRVADEFSIAKGSRRVPCLQPDGGSVPDIVWKTNAHNAPVRRVTFAPGGETLASCGEDGKIKLWDVARGTLLNEWRGDQGMTDYVLFLPDASYLISNGTDGQIKFWQNSEPILDRTLEANLTFQLELPLAYSPATDVLASSASLWHPFGYWMSGAINLWRVGDGSLVLTFSANHGWGLDCSRDGAEIVSASRDGLVRRWRASDGSETATLAAGITKVVKYSPDSSLIATGGADRMLKLWRSADGALLRTLVGHNDVISALAFSPDGATLVTAGQFDSTLCFWRVADGELLRTFYRECYAVNSIAFSADGYLFAYARTDNVIVLARNPFPPPGLTVSDGATIEGHSAQFTVRLSPPAAETISVSFATSNGSATGAIDFVHTNAVLSFAPGETNKSIAVTSINDALRETNEFFRVALSNPVNAIIRIGQGTGVIMNDDPFPVLAVSDTVVEEDAGNLIFHIALSTPTAQRITLEYFTDNETAFAPDDYEPAVDSLVFLPGETNKSVSISVRLDATPEPAEAIELRLMNVRNASFASLVTLGWIIDDDGMPGQLSHFEWNSVAATQHVNEPFPVTIRAKDSTGETLTSFAGTANLAGLKPPTALFRDDFEDGNISDWLNRAAVYVRAVTNDTAAEGSRSLTLIGGGRYRFDGVAHPLGGIQPGQINFHVRSTSALKSGAYLVVATNDTLQGAAICFKMDGTNGMGLEEGGRFHGVPYLAHRWYKVSLVLDWSAQRVVYYVDDQLVQQGIPFCTPNVRRLNVVHLYNFDHVQSWWDNIEFLQETNTTPILIAPSTTGAFIDGLWSGDVTILQPATNMVLIAQADGTVGTANPFSAIAFRPVILQAPLTQSVVANGNVTFSVLMSGTLPMQYEWRKLQAPLFTNAYHLNDNLSFFTLTNVQANWAGNYLLTVRSVAGMAAVIFGLAVLPDADADGLPDTWESAYNVTDPAADADGDGLNNLAEYRVGTVPTNTASVLRLMATLAGNALHLQFQASSNQTYTIQQTPTLVQTDWLKLVDIPARGTNFNYQVTNSLGSGAIYRLLTPVP